jgi:hypothetical protein
VLIIRKFITRCKSPNIDHYRSGSNTDNYEGQEGKVNKIEEKLLKLRLHVDKLKNELETLTRIRFEEAQISHKLNEIISYQSTDNFKNNNLFESSKSVMETNHKLAIENKKTVENNLFFATESHLVWIDSVLDLLRRRKEMKNRLEFITQKLMDGNDKEAEYDFANEQITLQEKVVNIDGGLNFELQLLNEGSMNFFQDKLYANFIVTQNEYLSECIKYYNKGVLENCGIDSDYNNKYLRDRTQSFGNEEQEVKPKFGGYNSGSDNEEENLENDDYT